MIGDESDTELFPISQLLNLSAIVEPDFPDMSDPSQSQQPDSALPPDEKTVEPNGPVPALDLTTLYAVLQALNLQQQPQRPPPSYKALTPISSTAWNREKDPILERSKDNWKSWSERVSVILRQYNASNYVSSEAYQMVPPDAEGRMNWEGAHNMICGFILTTISPKEIGPFKSITAAKELWESLEDVYNQPGLLSRCDINSKIWNHPFSWSTPIADQLHDLRELVGSLYEQGIPSENDLYLLAIMWNLNSPDMASEVLPQARTVINSNKSADHDDITRILLQIETDRKRTHASRVDQAHVATTNKSSKPGAGKGKGPGKPNKVTTKCTNCNRNHDVKYCVAEGGGMAGRDVLESIIQQRLDRDNSKGLKFAIGKKTVSIADIAALMSDTKTEKAETTPTEIASFLADSVCEADHVELANSTVEETCNLDLAAATSSITSTDFLLDSACTVHVSPFKDDFISLHPVDDRKVRGVNGSTVRAQGVGDILLRDNDGTQITLKDALYIPQSTVRLISIARLIDDIPSRIEFDNTDATIYDNSNNRIASGTRIPGHNLWRLNHAPIPIDSANIALTTPTLETWHRRLGHANVQSIYDMAKKGLVTGMKIDLSLAPPKCDHCILGKQVRSPVPKEREEERSMRRLGLVYVDLTGPQEVMSACGNNYVMNVVDDFTSYTWSYVMPHKSDAFRFFKTWLLRAEKESGHTVGVVQIDNGELKSNEMTEFCNSRAIRVRYTAPDTSAHNGKVERMHLTIMNKARTMRIQTGLPANRWDEFVKTASYLTVRTYTRSTGKTPYELWFKRKPDLSHLREIGARAFTLILNKHNPKIQPRSIECVLIGYADDSKAYRLYHRQTHKVITSFHVQFIESIDSEPRTLRSGRVIDIPSTISPMIPTSPSTPTADHIPAIDPTPNANAESETSHPRRSARIKAKNTSDTANILGEDFVASTLQVADGEAPPPTHDSPSPKSMWKKRARERRKMRLAIRTAMASMPQDVAEDFYEIAMAVAVEESSTPMINPASPNDPKSIEEALGRPDGDKWKAAIEEELKSLRDRGVYVLVPRSSIPDGRKVMSGKWVLVSKRDELGIIARWKARLVARGFEQVFGLDFTDTTSPTTRLESLRILLHLAAINDWDIRQLDIKTAYLYGVLPEEEIQYMEQPKGFEEPGKENWVWELRKGLYGMKQSGRVWNKTLNDALDGWKFERLLSEPCGFRRESPEGIVDACVHVDDFLFTPSNEGACNRFLADVGSTWEFKDLGEAKFCVGIAFTRDREAKKIGLSQTALIEKVANNFLEQPIYPTHSPMDPNTKLQRPNTSEKLSTANVKRLKSLPYRSLVGSMMYIASGSRPDVAYAVSKLAQFLDCYRDAHWDAALRVARYLYTTKDMKLWLGGENPNRLIGFSDSSYADCPDTRRSSMGYCFSLGSGVVSWSSRKQKTVSSSTTEAKYIAAGEATRESIWLRTHLNERKQPCDGATIIFCDNNGAITLTKDPIHHARNKHIDVRHHFIRERVENQEVDIWRVSSEDNIADIMTKPLVGANFERLRDGLGVR
ncbi:hypothetical protein NP233_g5535 [Leucocoprinus birnbaumii]|uniref:Integrase catalytic domain-containing protein n=1 Tax=Leucocoprinus birnbaumii TaxID=56174 RepID=A0AAD5VSN5_9AGAR|nr:hypothetical protein NP233_g5535 [Leucocoprinus birnbaumii]